MFSRVSPSLRGGSQASNIEEMADLGFPLKMPLSQGSFLGLLAGSLVVDLQPGLCTRTASRE